MGIVFGRSKNHVKVLNTNIKETQSLPVIKLKRKDMAPARCNSYHTVTLPKLDSRLPNYISDSDDEVGGMQVVPAMVTLPNNFNNRTYGGLPPIMHQQRAVPVVVAELSSDENTADNVVVGRTQLIEREKTVLMENILGRRLEELKSRGKEARPHFSSRESYTRPQYLTSRESYRKTCLKSRKRFRKNSYMSESSITADNRFSDEYSGSNKDTVSETDVGTDLLKLDYRKRATDTFGCKLSRRSTLNSALNFSSSSDGGFGGDYPYSRSFRKSSNFRKRGNISQLSNTRMMVTVAASVTGKVTEKAKMNSRVSSAWDSQRRTRATSSANGLCVSDSYEYDAESEMSSSESEDELNYATRHKTNPFLTMRTSASIYSSRARKKQTAVTIRSDLVLAMPVDKSVINMLPNYAKSSYQTTTTFSNNFSNTTLPQPEHNPNTTSHQQHTSNSKSNIDNTKFKLQIQDMSTRYELLKNPGPNKKKRTEDSNAPSDADKISVIANNQNSRVSRHPIRVRQNDAFDELDTAVEMLDMLL